MMRIDPAVFGASREALRDALEAEGVPCSAGYGYSLPDQPLFRNKAFGPFLPAARERIDYGAMRCPNSDRLCREQALWLGQNLLLGTDADVDDIVMAFEKIHALRDALTALGPSR